MSISVKAKMKAGVFLVPFFAQARMSHLIEVVLLRDGVGKGTSKPALKMPMRSSRWKRDLEEGDIGRYNSEQDANNQLKISECRARTPTRTLPHFEASPPRVLRAILSCDDQPETFNEWVETETAQTEQQTYANILTQSDDQLKQRERQAEPTLHVHALRVDYE
ncbi:hypothetical protein BJV74DRAFT_901333 [Russula compacta]|nr:hypothetical protein BJV74DRAFT_901333 [Russula compacta]